MWAALCDTLQHGMEWSAAAGTLHAVALRLHQLPKPAAQHPTSTCMYLRPLLTSAAGTDTPTNTAMTRMRRLKSCTQRSKGPGYSRGRSLQSFGQHAHSHANCPFSKEAPAAVPQQQCPGCLTCWMIQRPARPSIRDT